MSQFTHDLLVKLGFRSEEFSKGAEQSQGKLSELNSKFDELGTTAKAALATGVVGGAVVAGKAIYEMGKRGADVIQTGESFEFLQEKLGLMPDLLQQLRTESKGTISDLDLMSGTTKLLAGTSDELGQKLGNATPELIKIAKAANKLNPALGDTAFMYDSIALGIKRASPMILDNLGITIKIGEVNENFAKSLGKTVEQLTTEERAMAILNATLDSGQNLINQVGGTVDSAADSYAQMEVSVQNLKDQLMAGLAPAVSQVVDEITPAVTGVSGWIQAETTLNDLLDRNIITTDEYKEKIRSLHLWMTSAGEVVDWAREQEEDFKDEMLRATRVVDEHEAGLKRLDAATKDVITSTGDAEIATRDLKQEFSDLKSFIAGPLGKENEKYIQGQEDLKDRMDEVRAKINLLNGLKHRTPEQEKELDDLKGDYEELSLKYTENADAHDEATKRIMFNLLTQRAEMDGLTKQELDQLNNIALQWGLLDKATFDYVENADKYFALIAEDSIDNMGTVRWELEKTMGIVSDTKEAFGDLKSSLVGLSGTYDIKIRTFYETFGKPGEFTVPQPQGPPAPGGQHGLSMIVPPGYPNDTFPIWASSGEHVAITPSNKINRGTGGYPNTVYIRGGDNIFINQSAAAAYMAEKQLLIEMAEIDGVL